MKLREQMIMKIKPNVHFIPNGELERQANFLIDRYHKEIEPILTPPIPVEQIADFLLDLAIDWTSIPDDDDAPILAFIDPETNSILINENRRDFFDKYWGTQEYTLAHEVGHYVFHLTECDFQQMNFDLHKNNNKQSYLCRQKNNEVDRREFQAEKFGSFLLMPTQLLLPAYEKTNLSWSSLYNLRDNFCVSITALTKRLQSLGCLYIDDNKNLFRTKSEAHGQLSLFK